MMTRQTCLITGAASGIGEALAHRFGAAGMRVIGVDIDRDAAQEVESTLRDQGIEGRFLVADLTSAPERHQLVLDAGAVDVVIHSAGTSAVGHFAKSALSEQQRVIDLNLEAPIQLTTELLRTRAVRRDGSIVFVSSLSKFMGYPGASVYAATKDGLASYARSLAVALAPQRIHVATVYPGPTRTPHARRFSPDPDAESNRMPPEAVARAVYAAVRRRKRIVIPGVLNKAFATFGHLTPGVAGRMMKKLLLDKMD